MTIVVPSLGFVVSCITSDGGSHRRAVTVSTRIVLQRNMAVFVQVFLASNLRSNEDLGAD
jgi:hypothetical protein